MGDHLVNMCGIRYLMQILYWEGSRRSRLILLKLSGMHISPVHWSVMEQVELLRPVGHWNFVSTIREGVGPATLIVHYLSSIHRNNIHVLLFTHV